MKKMVTKIKKKITRKKSRFMEGMNFISKINFCPCFVSSLNGFETGVRK